MPDAEEVVFDVRDDERRHGSGRRLGDSQPVQPGTRPHQVIVNPVTVPPASSAMQNIPSMGLSGKLAQWGNVSALVMIAFLFWQNAQDQRNRDTANAGRLDAWLAKSEDRELRAWEYRAKDRESALKHGDEAVRQVTAAITQQTIEIGKMTRAVEALVEKKQ